MSLRAIIWKTIQRFVLGALVLSVLWVGMVRFVDPPGTALMGWRTLQGETVRQDWVPLEEISPELVRAVIAAEDNKFCRHIGFDFGEMREVWQGVKAGGKWRGASTISQQTAKNTFLWPSRDPLRKLAEVWFTGLEELFWSKRRVMEVYLNIAEWGGGSFGAEAASQYWFGKSAKDLTTSEASLLAAILPNPRNWKARPPGPYVSKRSGDIRKRMAQIREYGWDSCVHDKQDR